MASSCEGARCRCSGLWCDPFQPSALTGASELGDVVWANMHELLAPLVIAPFGAVAEAESVLGMVDIVVNNAGIPDAQRAHKMPIDLVDRVFDTNLRGPWILATEVARRLIDTQTRGRIINISSSAAFSYTGGGAALYSVTKAGIARMTEVLAVEWARNHINVNAIAPGAFHSEMMDGMLERVGDISMHFPRQRICEPNQLDSTLLYLCSPASDAVTGTVIRVDDGQSGR